jgi:hypothetical protein
MVIEYLPGAADVPTASGIELMAVADLLPAVAMVNCGGEEVDSFVTDSNFKGGSPASVSTPIDTSGVIDAAPSAVYQTERWGSSFTYTFTDLMAGAAYLVQLHFAETQWSSVGQRRFHVLINGKAVLTDFDIVAAAAGPNKANVQSFTVVANSSGQMVIEYLPGAADLAKVNGITIRPATLLRAINAGGGAAGSFGADSYASGGAFTATTQPINSSGVANPAPQAVYQSQREGNSFTYTLPDLMPGATYTVRLHFAETHYSRARQRRFHVDINGTRVLMDFDIVAAAGGPLKALVREFTTVANSNGQIVIQYLPGSAGNPQSNGIEILK